jgi:hydrogenase maturation protease
MTPPRAVLIGLGNRYRRDDGVGAEVADRIAAANLPGILISRAREADPAALLELWAETNLVVAVDAAHSEAGYPGRIRRLELNEVADTRGETSTHGWDLGAVVRLAAALGRRVPPLVVITVDVADLGHGTGLSPPVAAAVPDLVAAVIIELTGAPDAVAAGRDENPDSQD